MIPAYALLVVGGIITLLVLLLGPALTKAHETGVPSSTGVGRPWSGTEGDVSLGSTPASVGSLSGTWFRAAVQLT